MVNSQAAMLESVPIIGMKIYGAFFLMDLEIYEFNLSV